MGNISTEGLRICYKINLFHTEENQEYYQVNKLLLQQNDYMGKKLVLKCPGPHWKKVFVSHCQYLNSRVTMGIHAYWINS